MCLYKSLIMKSYFIPVCIGRLLGIFFFKLWQIYEKLFCRFINFRASEICPLYWSFYSLTYETRVKLNVPCLIFLYNLYNKLVAMSSLKYCFLILKLYICYRKYIRSLSCVERMGNRGLIDFPNLQRTQFYYLLHLCIILFDYLN